jgi:type IV secretion system protein VirD4
MNEITNSIINRLYKFSFFDNLSYFINNLDSLRILQVISFAVLFMLIRFIIRLTFRFKRKSRVIANLHGSARFATLEEVKNTSLLGNSKGVFVGAIEDKKKNWHYLRHDGAEHCLALAPTRSGKGICLVVPTLLSWQASTIVLDIKRELWHLTSNYRKTLGDCYLFDPSSPDSACFNPLAEVRIFTDKQVSDAQNIANMLVDGQGKGLESHWDKTSAELLTGTILHLLYKDKNATISDILNFFVSNTNIYLVMHSMVIFECVDKIAQGEINNVGKSMFSKSEKELSSIISSATACLSIFRDPTIQKITQYSQFSINDLMNKEKPVSLYIASDPSNMDRLRPLIRLIMNQILRKLTEKMEYADGESISPHKHKLLLMLDEFTSLGYLEILQKSLAFMASYGIKGYFIAQDISQIHQYYTKFESITANCHIQIAFTPNKLETAKYLSELLGNKTEYKIAISNSGKSGHITNDNYSSSMQEIKRPLMTTEELLTMSGLKKKGNKVIDTGNMIIFVNGQKPIFGKQAPYFVNSTMMSRVI